MIMLTHESSNRFATCKPSCVTDTLLSIKVQLCVSSYMRGRHQYSPFRNLSNKALKSTIKYVRL